MPRFPVQVHDEIYDIELMYGDLLHSDTEWKGKELPSLSPGDVVYHFIKGHGWVPETPLSLKLSRDAMAARQAAKQMNFGTPSRTGNFGYPGGMASNYGERMRELQDRMVRDAARYWASYEAPRARNTPPQIPREPRRERAYTTDTWNSPLTGVGNRQHQTYARWVGELSDTQHHIDSIRYAYNYSYTGAPHGNTNTFTAAPRQNTPRARTNDELAENSGSRYFPGSGAAAEPQRQESIHERRLREYREASARFRRGR
jgi:hypothetical protein